MISTLITFKDLFTLYYERHALVKNRCPENTRYFYKAHGPRWEVSQVDTITRWEVQIWVDELGLDSPSAANRAVNTLAAIITWGIKRGYVHNQANPCKGVERFRLRARDRFLLPGELESFRASLSQETDLLRDFFWMCLLTGARRGNVQAMSWREIDFTLKIWRFDQKNDDIQIQPLATTAVDILNRRRCLDGEWVFPSPRNEGAHLVEPKRAWARVMKRAKLDDLTIHDLRRTLGSYMAINGESQYVIGKALGHRDPRSTAIYAKLHLDPVRAAFEVVQDRLTGQLPN